VQQYQHEYQPYKAEVTSSSLVAPTDKEAGFIVDKRQRSWLSFYMLLTVFILYYGYCIRQN